MKKPTAPTPKTMVRIYWALSWVFVALTLFCLIIPFGQHLAQSVAYVTFISHLALVLSMLGAVEASKVVQVQDDDANVSDVLDVVQAQSEHES